MAKTDDYQVGGYRFSCEEDYTAAQEELQKVDYFRKKTGGKDAAALLTIYDRILDEKIFTTPIGFDYLQSVRTALMEQGYEEQLRPIPLYMQFVHKSGADLEKENVRQRIRPSKKKNGLSNLQISVFLNILLGILVIAMFGIALKSDNPNILNYKLNLQNEYAAWEQELTEREKTVREKERELNITAEEDEVKEDGEAEDSDR